MKIDNKESELQNITFCVGKTTMLFNPNGEIYINNRLISQDKEIYEGFRDIVLGFHSHHYNKGWNDCLDSFKAIIGDQNVQEFKKQS